MTNERIDPKLADKELPSTQVVLSDKGGANGAMSRLILRLDGDRIHYNFWHQDRHKQSPSGIFPKITRTSLSDCLSKIRHILEDVSENPLWNKLGYRLDAPQSESEAGRRQRFAGKWAISFHRRSRTLWFQEQSVLRQWHLSIQVQGVAAKAVDVSCQIRAEVR